MHQDCNYIDSNSLWESLEDYQNSSTTNVIGKEPYELYLEWRISGTVGTRTLVGTPEEDGHITGSGILCRSEGIQISH